MTSAAAHGWNTTKTDDGFKWDVTRVVWSDDANRAISTTLKAGVSPSRARAAAQAKRWVLFFRRGGHL